MKPYQNELRDIWDWESPVRCSGHRILEPIPAEIYLMIFDYLRARSDRYGLGKSAPKRFNDLRNLSLVCRYFCAEILPWLFESIIFHPISHKDAPGKDQMGYVSFCKSIERDEIFARSLALRVKHCTMRDWVDVPKTIAQAFLNVHINVLPHMANLTTVLLSRMRLVPPLLTHIRRLSHLESLTIDCCDFEEIFPKHVQKLALKCKLKSFRLYHRNKEDIHRLDDSIAEEFIPLVMHLSELGTDNWRLIRTLISCDTPLSNLETLKIIFVEDLKPLCRYLYQLPALKSLTMDNIQSRRSHSPYLISVPLMANLRHLTCPPHLISSLTGLHKLVSLSFATCQEDDILSALIRVTPSPSPWRDMSQLVELCLPYAFAVSILKHPNPARTEIGFAQLRTLIILLDECFLFSDWIYKDPARDSITVSNEKTELYDFFQAMVQKLYLPNVRSFSFRGLAKDWVWDKEETTDQWKLVEEDDDVY
ncbi:hypothetical protein F5050DRAFT_88441 [Lentinula boryana]|uniref:F-box domain-containing protein n=1 Tax=Lentinula boryana TaxID=40481 RepID=A0ABQ8QRY2_9AGAR|nr:hypothetical protein F5050DRAFT_88441 [Lentinula boryana]